MNANFFEKIIIEKVVNGWVVHPKEPQSVCHAPYSTIYVYNDAQQMAKELPELIEKWFPKFDPAEFLTEKYRDPKCNV
jgi:hypothetical protein